MKHLLLNENEAGTDYVLADVNGCFNELTSLLSEVGFTDDDRLFLLGNLINHGLYSKEVVDFAKRINVFPMLGNEEYLMLYALSPSLSKSERLMLMKQWDASGGSWRFSVSKDDLELMYDQIMEWPISITLEADVKFGLVHAECPYDDWDRFVKSPITLPLLQSATLGQGILQGDRDGVISNVDIVVSGHTQLARPPVIVGKCHYINHGMVIGKPARIYKLSDFYKES